MGALLKVVTAKSALAFGVLILFSNSIQAQGEQPPAATAIQPPQAVGTGSSQTLEYVRDTTVTTPQALTTPVPAPAVQQATPPVAPVDVPATPAPATPKQMVAETPAAKKPYIEIDLDLLREKMDRPRKSQRGGGGGFTPMLMFMDMEPISQLAATDPFLKAKKFDLSSSNIMLWGGMGYGGVGDGIRIGGGGWGGYSTFYSTPFLNPADSTAVDSVVEISVIPAFGCMIIEKAFTIDRLNLIVGGSMGAGALVVVRNVFSEDEGSAFFNSDDSTRFNEDTDIAVAPLTMLGLHGGATYSMLSWLHLGADGGVHLFHSSRGFGYGFGSFNTVNPFIRLRLIFGNMG